METAVLSLAIILLAVSIRTALAVNGADKALHGVIPGGPSNGGSNNARVSARDVIEERHDRKSARFLQINPRKDNGSSYIIVVIFASQNARWTAFCVL